MNPDLGAAFWHALTNPHIEWDIGPTPIVNQDAKGNVGLGLRIRFDVLFFPIADCRLFFDRSGAVLRTDHAPRNIFAGDSPERSQDFHFFIAYRVGPQVSRRFHRDQAKQLQQMVLDHVSKRAGPLVITSPIFDPQLLAGGYLYVIDVAL